MIKRAPLELFRAGSVQPGKYIILIGGSVAAVTESHDEALRRGAGGIASEVLLPVVHEQVFESVAGVRRENSGDALGIIEMASIPHTVRSADKAVKAADVTIVEIRLGDGLGGKGITHLTGELADVEAAVDAGVQSAGACGADSQWSIIPAQHGDLRIRINQTTRFGAIDV